MFHSYALRHGAVMVYSRASNLHFLTDLQLVVKTNRDQGLLAPELKT